MHRTELDNSRIHRLLMLMAVLFGVPILVVTFVVGAASARDDRPSVPAEHCEVVDAESCDEGEDEEDDPSQSEPCTGRSCRGQSSSGADFGWQVEIPRD